MNLYNDSPLRYDHDPTFRNAVTMLEKLGEEQGYTPGELKQIAFYAALRIEERRMPAAVRVGDRTFVRKDADGVWNRVRVLNVDVFALTVEHGERRFRIYPVKAIAPDGTKYFATNRAFQVTDSLEDAETWASGQVRGNELVVVLGAAGEPLYQLTFANGHPFDCPNLRNRNLCGFLFTEDSVRAFETVLKAAYEALVPKDPLQPEGASNG